MEMQKPYIQTELIVSKRQDTLLHSKQRPQDLHDILVEESGGSVLSKSMSQLQKNIKEIYNRKNALNKKSQVASTGGAVNSLIKIVIFTDNVYISLVSTGKQLNDVEKFCCKATNSSILAVETFNLCDMWITDTSYQNMCLLNTDTRKNPVYLGLIIVLFTKHEKTFSQFALELCSENPNFKNLKAFGVTLESAIFKDTFKAFKSV